MGKAENLAKYRHHLVSRTEVMEVAVDKY